MPVTLTQDEFNTFKQHGATAESIQNTVNHYRSQGLDDTAIRAKIDAKLNSWTTPVQPQPKNVVPNRPANQELKVEEPTQEVKSDFQLNATKNYTQEMGADGKTYLVDENGNRVVNNDLSGIEKFKRKGQAFLSNLGDYINAAPGTEQWKDKAKKIAFAESMFIPGSVVHS